MFNDNISYISPTFSLTRVKYVRSGRHWKSTIMFSVCGCFFLYKNVNYIICLRLFAADLLDRHFDFATIWEKCENMTRKEHTHGEKKNHLEARFCDWMAFSHIINTFPLSAALNDKKHTFLVAHKCDPHSNSHSHTHTHKLTANRQKYSDFALNSDIVSLFWHKHVGSWVEFDNVACVSWILFSHLLYFFHSFCWCCSRSLSIVFDLILMLRQGWELACTDWVGVWNVVVATFFLISQSFESNINRVLHRKRERMS